MLCVFDFDGTLADSKSAYYKTFHLYAQKNNFPAPSQQMMDGVFGNPNPSLIEGWGDLETFKKHLDNVFSLVDDVLCENPHCMPLFSGIFKLLENLRNDNIELAIVTSRNLKPLLAVMDSHRITSFFKIIRSAQDMLDHGYRGKPHPDKLESVLKETACLPQNALMIGDTHMDMEMAKMRTLKQLAFLGGIMTKTL